MGNPHFKNTTEHLSRADQFADFREETAAFGVRASSVNRDEKDGFRAKVSGYAAGPTVVMSFETDAYLQRQDERTSRTAAMDHWLLGLWRHGSGDFDVQGKSIHRRQGHLQIQSVHKAHEGRYNGQEITFVLLPRDSLKGLESALDHLCKIDSVNAFHPLLKEYIRIVWDNMPLADPADFSVMGETTLAMVRACMLRTPEAIMAASSPIAATQLALAKQLIASQLWSPVLSAQSISAQLALSRRQLYKIFEPEGGVGSFIRASRLKASYRRIVAAGHHESIRSIAEDLGFRDQASFGRQFRNQFGFRPSEVKGAGIRTSQPRRFSTWAEAQAPR